MDEKEEANLYRLALENIRKRGVKFTVEDLCRDAKISKKTFYLLYPSKGSFAKKAYAYAFAQFDEAEKKYVLQKEPNGAAFNLFASYSDLLMITSEETFNLYSLEHLLRDEAVKEKEKRRERMKQDLFSSFTPQASNHPSLFVSIESTLSALARENDRKSLLKDYLEVLTPLWKSHKIS